ncbi:MAG: site-specific integrase [candidate division KSB1 bacterium]|nr:site-specific integrase [candidate division KSB1 bacterium]
MSVAKRKQKRGPAWLVQVMAHGKRVSVMVHGTKQMAREVEAQMRREIKLGKFGFTPKQTPGLLDFAKEFLAYCRVRCRPATVERYACSLKRWGQELGNIRLGEITPMHIQKFIETRGLEVKESSLNRDIEVLRRLFTVAEERGLVRDVARLFKGAKLKETQKPARYLTEEEQARLFAACRTQNEKLFVHLGLYAGLRLGEILGLRWRDVDFGANTLTVSGERAKTRKTRTVNLAPQLRKVLLDSVRRGDFVVCKGNGKAYKTGRTLWRRLTKRAGLRDATPHALRHTFATGLLHGGVDLFTIQELGGWSSVQMVRRYAHVTVDAKRQAVEKLGALIGRAETLAEAEKLLQSANNLQLGEK